MKNFSEKAKKKIIAWRKRAGELFSCNKELSGITVIELVLILVIIIALLLIFKNQLVSLINSIFDRITSESAGI